MMLRSIQRPVDHLWRSHRLVILRLFSSVPEPRETRAIPNWSKLFNSTRSRAEIVNFWNPAPKPELTKHKLKREKVEPKDPNTVANNTSFDKLLKAPAASLDSKTPTRSAFIDASSQGDAAMVKKYLQTNCLSLLQHCPKGRTALVAASMNGHIETVKILVAALPSENHLLQQSKLYRRTALMEASKQGHLEIVEFLLSINSSGRHIQQKDSLKKTAFALAKNNGHTKICDILNAKHAENLANKNKRRLVEAAEKGDIDIVKILLSKDSSIEKLLVKGESGGTALMEASKNGHMMIVRYLLAKNSSDQHLLAECNGRTALTEATQNGHRQIAKLLKKIKN